MLTGGFGSGVFHIFCHHRFDKVWLARIPCTRLPQHAQLHCRMSVHCRPPQILASHASHIDTPTTNVSLLRWFKIISMILETPFGRSNVKKQMCRRNTHTTQPRTWHRPRPGRIRTLMLQRTRAFIIVLRFLQRGSVHIRSRDAGPVVVVSCVNLAFHHTCLARTLRCVLRPERPARLSVYARGTFSVSQPDPQWYSRDHRSKWWLSLFEISDPPP